MIVCLDTNILVSGAARPDSLPGSLVLAFLDGAFTLVTSEYQLNEFARVSRYPRVKKFLKPARAGFLMNKLRTLAMIVEPGERLDVSPDPDDNVIIAVAVAGNAQWLVSGDAQHVVGLKKVGSVRIVTAAQAVALLKL
jgi:uncharacterized protein